MRASFRRSGARRRSVVFACRLGPGVLADPRAMGVERTARELGHTLHPTPMRTSELASAQVDESVEAIPAPVSRPPEPAPVTYGPPQWARLSYTKGFAGADFSLQPDGTLRCPAGKPLYAQERRKEASGSLRVLYAARIGHCRSCPLREHCQEAVTTGKARRVSAVYWPGTSQASITDED